MTIAGGKLFIANGNITCPRGAGCGAIEAQLPLLRRTTQSLSLA